MDNSTLWEVVITTTRTDEVKEGDPASGKAPVSKALPNLAESLNFVSGLHLATLVEWTEPEPGSNHVLDWSNGLASGYIHCIPNPDVLPVG